MSELGEEDSVIEQAPAAPTAKVSSARHTLNIFTTRIFTLPVTIITSIMVVKALGATQRGIYEFLVLQGTLSLPLLMLGLNASATYFVSTRRYTVNQVFVTCLATAFMQGLLGTLLLTTLWRFDLLGQTAKTTATSMMLPILLILPLQSSILSLTRLALGDSWFTLNNRVQLFTALLTAALMWVLVIIGGYGVQGAVIGIVATNALILAGILIAFLRRYRPALSFDRQYLREAWRYGLRAWLADVAVTTNGRLDKFVLGAVATPDRLGVYGPVVMITEMLWVLPDSISFVLQNKIAAARDKEEQAQLVDRLNRIVFWTMTLGAVVVLVVAPPLMVLFWGADYEGCRGPMGLLMLGTVSFCTVKVLTKYFAGTGRPHYSGTTVLVGALVGMPLYLLLIPPLGIIGAAIAHSACYIVTGATAAVIYRRLVSPHKPRLIRPEFGDAAWLEQQVRLVRGRRQPGQG